MSFANDVKEELSEVMVNARHCQLSEIAAIETFALSQADPTSVYNRKLFTLRKKTDILNRCAEADFRRSCCRRAYLRGAFLCVGYINDPEKSYNLEFVCDTDEKAEKICECLESFGVFPKRHKRKENFVIYIKEAEAIVDILNILGAHRSLMYMETLRVEKDVRNSINRKVNCETANIAKTINASSKQIEDIIKIKNSIGLESLPKPLYEIAVIRLENEECSLTELGGLLDPPVGKSGVNHRLRKISNIASRL